MKEDVHVSNNKLKIKTPTWQQNSNRRMGEKTSFPQSN